ncbi:MAG: hypothetical protein QW265_04160, partial [Candidatus Bathyarchaeia archaeon]
LALLSLSIEEFLIFSKLLVSSFSLSLNRLGKCGCAEMPRVGGAAQPQTLNSNRARCFQFLILFSVGL